MTITFENPVFDAEQTNHGGVANGKIIEPKKENAFGTKDDDDEEEDNVGFEKLSEKGNKIGLIVYNVREGLIEFIRQQKVLILAVLLFPVISRLRSFSVGSAMEFEFFV